MPLPDRNSLIRFASAAADSYSLRPPTALVRGPTGVYLGPETGTSIDFHDYRPYQPGDDLRRVDWGVYARSDTLVVRLFRIEVAPVVEVVLDTSASMSLHEGKLAAGVFLAGFLAGVTRKAEGRPVLVTGASRFPGSGFEEGLALVRFDGRTDPPDESMALSSSGRPVRFFISDFLYPADMERFLGKMARNSAVLVSIVLLSESECSPGFQGGVRFVDAENDSRWRDIRIDRSAITRYQKRLESHFSTLDHITRGLRSRLIRMDVPDTFPENEQILGIVAKQLVNQEIVEPG